jgi:hypothetical protein
MLALNRPIEPTAQSGHSLTSSLTTSGLLIHLGIQVATAVGENFCLFEVAARNS